MLRTRKSRLATGLATAALTVGLAVPAAAQPNNVGVVGGGLVGPITVVDAVDVNNNTVQIPIGVAANVCDVDVAVLAEQRDQAVTGCTAENNQLPRAFRR